MLRPMPSTFSRRAGTGAKIRMQDGGQLSCPLSSNDAQDGLRCASIARREQFHRIPKAVALTRPVEAAKRFVDREPFRALVLGTEHDRRGLGNEGGEADSQLNDRRTRQIEGLNVDAIKPVDLQ